MRRWLQSTPVFFGSLAAIALACGVLYLTLWQDNTQKVAYQLPSPSTPATANDSSVQTAKTSEPSSGPATTASQSRSPQVAALGAQLEALDLTYDYSATDKLIAETDQRVAQLDPSVRIDNPSENFTEKVEQLQQQLQ